MNKPNYEFHQVERELIFEFESVSEEKIIRKIILYELLNESNQVYNLALLDVMDDGSLDDMNESNNNDLETILATIVKTIPVFFNKFPKASLFFTGSTKIRTRLYRIVISNYFEEIGTNYIVFGLKNGKREKFVKNQEYEGFLLKLK